MNASGSSCSPAWERCSNTTSSLSAIALVSGSANRVEVTRSCAPKVISVGRLDVAERRAGVVRDGRLGLGQERIQRLGRAAAHEVRRAPSTNSGRSAYISGVKQNGKMPWMTASATAAARRAQGPPHLDDRPQEGSLGSQALCSDSERTRSGWRAARCMPTAAPSDTPATCARSTPIAPRKPANWSA